MRHSLASSGAAVVAARPRPTPLASRWLMAAAVIAAALWPAQAPAASSQVEDRRYQSPTYGYAVEWDANWAVSEEFSEGGYDLLTLESDLSLLYFEGQIGYDGDPQDCLAASIAELEREPAVGNVSLVDDTPRGGDDDAAAGTFVFDLVVEEDETVEETAYLECRTLVAGESVLEISHFALTDDFPAEAEAVATILASLDPTAAAPVANPAAATTAPAIEAILDESAASIDDYWSTVFQLLGRDYESPGIEYYDGPISTACGDVVPLDTGPHYCPYDRTIYVDMPFMADLVAPYGDFAHAFVLAHEWGHHIQDLLAIEQCALTQCLGATTSVEIELMADCLGGAWTGYQEAQGELAYGGAEAAVAVLATLVGDAEDTPIYDPGVHGPGSLRAYWFLQGLYGGYEICLVGVDM